MRIAQISTLTTPVRRQRSGSIEGHVWLLSHELTKMGHEVTIFGAGGSVLEADLVTTVPAPCGREGSITNWQLSEWVNICRALERANQFDVMHSHNYLWAVPLQPLVETPMVHTMHVMPADDELHLVSMYPRACVTAISCYQWDRFPNHQPSAIVYHGVEQQEFTFRSEPDDYVCYLGRFAPGKGTKVAIETARKLGLRLLLAGPRNGFFDQNILPLVDGHAVEYVGFMEGANRDQLLGGARALLYPIQNPEPFGLVMVEAMMCGTPVAAIGKGAVLEVVDEGVTGCIADSNDSFIDAVQRAFLLDRSRVRTRSCDRFSSERMAQEYLAVYESLIERRNSQ